jgi:hyperosmotically inducible periplasmic protein
MNSQTSRKIIVASGMAVVVALGVVIIALRSHSATSVPQTLHPPTPIAETPAAPAATAEIPTVPAAVAQTPDAAAAVAQTDSVESKSAGNADPSAVEPKLAHNLHPAKASPSAVATNDTVTRTESATDTSEKPATETVADSVTPPPVSSSSPADDQKAGPGTAFAASDSQITTDVRSEIAGDGLSKGVNIGVTTTHGVVVLTGSVASQEAIDHVKDVAGKVAGVKSVDTSALVLASL